MNELHDGDAQEGLRNLHEIMQTFGVVAWDDRGALDLSAGSGGGWLVDIEGERYTLRERPEGFLGEDLHHRYDFQRYLQQAGIPIPPLWFTPQGEPAVTVGGTAFELQRWVSGEPFATAHPRSLDWIALAGTMLGRIHRASLEYPGHQHRWPSEVHIGGIVQSYLNLARAKAAENGVPQAVSLALSEWVDQWEALLPNAMMSIGSGQHLPELHIHGDYHARNLRFNRSGITAVMGLEASRWEKRLFEVAYALFFFTALAWQPDDHLTPPLVKRGFEPERARRFLHAYGEVYPPVRGEALLLADALMLIAPMVTLNGPLEDLFYTQAEPDTVLSEDLIERLSWAVSLPAWLARVRHPLTEMWM